MLHIKDITQFNYRCVEIVCIKNNSVEILDGALQGPYA